MKTSSVIIIGLSAGALTMIFLAPYDGRKVRSEMARKSRQYKNYLKYSLYDMAHSISHPFESVEDQAIRLSKKAINKTEKVKADVLK